MSAIRTLIELADPRGRCNRAGFLLIALGMLVVQIAVVAVFVVADAAPDGPAAMAANVVFFWFVTTAVSKRLHDLGLSAWWIVKASIAIVAWAVVFIIGLMMVMDGSSFEPGGIGYYMAVGGTVVPVFVAILWLHCVHGEAGANAYGSAPDGL